MDYGAFAGQVLAYLEPEYQQHYRDRHAWSALQKRDVAALLQVSASNATTILRRLALAELISAPYPAYVSLQSALFHHGMIEQIPSVIYAVTPARTRRVRTPMGTISYHRMPAELFDLVYLARGKSRVFSTLPELMIPRRFQWKRLKEYTELVKSPGRRAFIAERIGTLRT